MKPFDLSQNNPKFFKKLEQMKEQKGYSKKLGLENASTIHGKKMNCDIKTMIEKGT